MRVERLKRFGEVQPWLADRVEAMSDRQWRLFYDQVELTERVPQTFEDTMPRSRDDFITNPMSAPEQYRAEEIAKWDAWREIWGAAPWEQQSKIRVRPRVAPFKD